MTQTRILSTVLAIAMLAITGCSSSFGSGSEPPHDTTVVVPPDSSATVSH